MNRLPRKHLLIGAGALLAFGLFLGAMTWLDADSVNRPYTDRPYALSEFIDWLVDLFGRPAASIIVVGLSALGASVLFAIASQARS